MRKTRPGAVWNPATQRARRGTQRSALTAVADMRGWAQSDFFSSKMAQRMTYMLAAAGGAVTASYVWLPSLERAKELQPRVDARQKRLDDLQAARSKGALTANEHTTQHQRLYPFACNSAPRKIFP